MSDIAYRYRLLSDGFLARIQAAPANRWDAASPCQGWTARDVVAHVINGHRGILAMVNGKPPAAADGVGISSMADAPQVEPGADLAIAFKRCRNDMHAMLSDPDRAVTRLPGGPLGPVPAEQAPTPSAAWNCWSTPGTWPVRSAATRSSSPSSSPEPTRPSCHTTRASGQQARSSPASPPPTTPTPRSRSCTSSADSPDAAGGGAADCPALVRYQSPDRKGPELSLPLRHLSGIFRAVGLLVESGVWAWRSSCPRRIPGRAACRVPLGAWGCGLP
jgi:hypothetical protein